MRCEWSALLWVGRQSAVSRGPEDEEKVGKFDGEHAGSCGRHESDNEAYATVGESQCRIFSRLA